MFGKRAAKISVTRVMEILNTEQRKLKLMGLDAEARGVEHAKNTLRQGLTVRQFVDTIQS